MRQKELSFKEGLERRHHVFCSGCKITTMIFQVVSWPSWPIPVRRKIEEHGTTWQVTKSLLMTLNTWASEYTFSPPQLPCERKWQKAWLLCSLLLWEDWHKPLQVNNNKSLNSCLTKYLPNYCQFQSYCSVWGLLHWRKAVWQPSRSHWLLHSHKVTIFTRCKRKHDKRNQFCSDLLKHERLAFPVPPPEPVNDKKRMVAILPYTKMPDTDEITFQVIKS